ncbi:hypothetical protein THOM_2368 [Trachipleistophora hominis]|uniref:Uncharacterized protein n=1 Tax=Trachipleistophora hominis TaxID=72359 RepID=L7JTI1_TRAHO|nr:hypothetical protein THOM_2368 [Trachipleistophora hominis]
MIRNENIAMVKISFLNYVEECKLHGNDPSIKLNFVILCKYDDKQPTKIGSLCFYTVNAKDCF